MRKQYPEVLADLAAQTAQVLVEKGIAEDLAMEVGADVAEHFRKHWGGVQIYVPMGQKLTLSARDLEIFQEFDGKNREEICRKHGISIRNLYRIINTVRISRGQAAGGKSDRKLR